MIDVVEELKQMLQGGRNPFTRTAGGQVTARERHAPVYRLHGEAPKESEDEKIQTDQRQSVIRILKCAVEHSRTNES
jgi:hypothetical protein